MPLWFIRELMALSLLAPLFWQILKRPVIAITLCLAILVLTTMGLVPYRSFVYWIPVYLLGASCNNVCWDRLVDVLNRNIAQIAGGLYCCILFLRGICQTA